MREGVRRTVSFKRSTACIIAAAVFWGCISLFYDGLATIGYTPLQVVFLRVSVAAIVMLVYCLSKHRSALRIRVKDIWMFIGTGVASLAFFNVCYFSAMDALSPSVAAVLLYTAPAFVTVMSAMVYHEAITVRRIVSLLMTALGCVFVTEVFWGTLSSPYGILLGLGAGFGYALYTIFSVAALRIYATETITLYTFVTAAVAVFPICDPSAMLNTAIIHPYETVWLSLGIGIVACVLPYWLYTKGLRGVSAGQASVMATLEPVVATVVGVMFLGDSFSVYKLFGMVCILGGIILLNIRAGSS